MGDVRPTERVFIGGHLPNCQCGSCGWQDVPEKLEVDGGTVAPKSLNKFEYFRELREKQAAKTAEQKQHEALAEKVDATQSWLTAPIPEVVAAYLKVARQ